MKTENPKNDDNKSKNLWRPRSFWDLFMNPEPIKPSIPKTYKPFSWAESRFKTDPDILQFSNQTRPERFPKIFNAIKDLYPTAKRICSFGCSKGDETTALSARWQEAEIIGIDREHYNLVDARRNNKSPNVFFHEHLGGLGNFDIIFCLMVLFCLEKPIDKERFTKTLTQLDAHLNPSGLLVLYTLEYDPLEILTPDRYEQLNVWTRKHNRFPDGKDFHNAYLRKKSITPTIG